MRGWYGRSLGTSRGMGIGTGIFLVAIGAILQYAVSDSIDGVELATVGLILMIVGAAGLVMSFFMGNVLRRDGAAAAPADEVVVERRPRV